MCNSLLENFRYAFGQWSVRNVYAKLYKVVFVLELAFTTQKLFLNKLFLTMKAAESNTL